LYFEYFEGFKGNHNAKVQGGNDAFSNHHFGVQVLFVELADEFPAAATWW